MLFDGYLNRIGLSSRSFKSEKLIYVDRRKGVVHVVLVVHDFLMP